MKLVRTAEQVRANIQRLSEELAATPSIADRFGLAHAWYIDASEPGQPAFGFSKFVGYQTLDAATYLNEYKKLTGSKTEKALKGFCEELRPGSSQFEVYHAKLREWLAKYGKAPRHTVRLLVLKSEPPVEDEAADRRLLELLAAVADMLPLDQRHELRSRL